MKPLLIAFFCTLLFAGAARADGYLDFNFGVASKNREDWDTAVKSLTLALSEPDLPQHLRAVAYLDRGGANFELKRFDDAIADETAAIQLKPGYIEAYFARADAYGAKNQYTNAIGDVTVGIGLRPSYLYGYYRRIHFYIETKNWAAAIADCTTLTRITPDDAEILQIRGEYHRRNGEFDLAITDETSALDIDSHLADAYAERGVDYAEKGDLSDALDDFKSEVRRAQNSPTAYLREGLAEWALGKFNDAADSFGESLKVQPLQKFAFLWLAITQARTHASIPADVSTRFAATSLADWPGPLVALFLGKATTDDVDQALKRVGAGDLEQDTCEASFFKVEWQFMHQTPPADGLQQTLRLCSNDAILGPAITAEIKRLPKP